MDQRSPLKSEIQSVFALYNNGEIKEALEAVEILINNYPDESLLYNIRGACYEKKGQLNYAVESFEKAIVLKPDYTEAQYNLGITLRALGQVDDAIKCYQDALTNKHAYPDVHNNLGNIFLELNQLEDATDHFEWAVAYKPDFAEAYNNLGSTLLRLGRVDAAIENYEKAVDIRPEYAQAHNNLGIAFQGLGQVDDSVNCYEKAIMLKPDYATAHHNLSAIKRYKKGDSQIAQIQSLLSNPNLNQSDRIYLCFALAKVYEDLGKQDEMFKVLHEGNSLRKKQLGYSLDKSENHNSIIRKIFSTTPTVIGKSIRYEKSTMRPIFIVGMLRSGTSLVEQIISSHHAVHGAGELSTFSKIIIPILMDYLTYDKHELPETTLLSIRQQYLDSLACFNITENVIIDKWPLNFRNIGFILSAFPEAKIIHVKRNSIATCWSIYKHYFSDKGNGWAYNLDDLARFYELYLDLMDYWYQLYPNKIYDICYEDLTVNQEKETRKLLKYCELDWDENCLNFHTIKREVKTASALQVRQKMYQGSSEAWKKYEAYLQPLIKALGS